jgi:hypothetical protein
MAPSPLTRGRGHCLELGIQDFIYCLVFGIGILYFPPVFAGFFSFLSLVVAYLTWYVILISKAKYIFVSSALGIEYKRR